MTSLKRLTTSGVLAAVMLSYSACAPTTGGRANAGTRTTGSESVRSERVENDNPTELWIHGLARTPDKAAQMHAKGVRFIIDLSTSRTMDVRSTLSKFVESDMGICITLRWSAGMEDDGRSRLDSPPSAQQANDAIDELMAALTSPEARQLEGRLWVQFYNEIAGGPGTFRPEDADALFNFATNAARRIRAEAPHVKISGPGITAPGVLDKSEDSLTGTSADRYRGLRRAIRWSIQYADAVDLHLHTTGGAEARRLLSIVRRAMDREPDGERCGIVVWEWSSAKARNRGDLQAAKQHMIDIWQAMNEHNVLAAAYSYYYVTPRLGDAYRWVTLTNESGQPREPFYSTFVDLAQSEGATESQPRQRGRNRRNNSIVSDGADEQAASSEATPVVRKITRGERAQARREARAQRLAQRRAQAEANRQARAEKRARIRAERETKRAERAARRNQP